MLGIMEVPKTRLRDFSPVNRPRRTVTAPSLLETRPPDQIATGSLVETLYHHSNVRIVAFAASGREISNGTLANPPSADDEQPGSLAWSSRLERTIAVGAFRIYRAPGSVAFLSSGAVLQPILPKSQCWCIDEEGSKYILQIRRPNYWRIELPTSTLEDKQRAEVLRGVLDKVSQFEKTECPFQRSFSVDLPERPQGPTRRKRWTPVQSPTRSHATDADTSSKDPLLQIADLQYEQHSNEARQPETTLVGLWSLEGGESLASSPNMPLFNNEDSITDEYKRHSDASSTSTPPRGLVKNITESLEANASSNVRLSPARAESTVSNLSPYDLHEGAGERTGLLKTRLRRPIAFGLSRSATFPSRIVQSREFRHASSPPHSDEKQMTDSGDISGSDSYASFHSVLSEQDGIDNPLSPLGPAQQNNRSSMHTTQSNDHSPLHEEGSRDKCSASDENNCDLASQSKSSSSCSVYAGQSAPDSRNHSPVMRSIPGSFISDDDGFLALPGHGRSGVASDAQLEDFGLRRRTMMSSSPSGTMLTLDHNQQPGPSRSKVDLIKTLPLNMLLRTCGVLLGPPIHLIKLMMKVAARINAGEWKGLAYGRNELGEQIPVRWDYSDETWSDWSDEDGITYRDAQDHSSLSSLGDDVSN